MADGTAVLAPTPLGTLLRAAADCDLAAVPAPTV